MRLLCILLLVWAVFAQTRVFPENDVIPQPSIHGWRSNGRSSSNAPLSFLIALKQQNTDALEEKFWAVSDPAHPEYGKYLSRDEVTQLVQATPENIAAVQQWLAEHNIHDIELSATRDMISVRATVAQVEALLGAEFETYSRGKDHIHRSLSYSLPEHVAKAIDFVGGISHFPPKSVRVSESVQSNGYGETTPPVIKARYHVDAKGGHAPQNLMGIASFLDQFIDPQDTSDFLQTYDLPNYKVQKWIGPNNPEKPGGEASLDIQYILATGENVSCWVWSTPGRHETQEPFLKWLYDVSQHDVVPQLFSISYGEPEDSITTAYQMRVGKEFQKAGVRGISLIYASGDSGSDCNEECTKFRPNFPAASPYVTSVGSTRFVWRGSEVVNETTADFSSGGFSTLHARPSFQERVVSRFLEKTPVPQSYFNAKGRAFPDVSTVGTTFVVNLGGFQTWEDGTSASAPVFGGMMALINDARLARGLPQMGFLTPFLYWAYEQDPTVFTDIVQGGSRHGCCEYGFHAQEGWDPITGLGTPYFPKLMELALRYRK